jgi:hypothetical protein
MSQENVELVRGQFEAWTRGDLAAVIERVDENGVVEVSRGQCCAFGVDLLGRLESGQDALGLVRTATPRELLVLELALGVLQESRQLRLQ